MSLQKDQIIQAALAILDRDGLEGVTLRRLASELNVRAASLYWHIPNKDALLDEMAERILVAHFASVDLADERSGWAEWLGGMASELRRAMLSRREGARVVAGAHLGIAVTLTALMERAVAVLRRAGLSTGDAATATMTMLTFAFGFVIEEQSSPPLGWLDADTGRTAASPSGIGAALREWQERGQDAGRRFETGVRIIIAGLRAEYALPPAA